MNRWLGWALAAVVVIVFVGGWLLRPGANDGQLGDPRPEVGYPAPDFNLESLDGGQIRLADYRGRAVFLNFWATWCGPCLVEMPEIARLKEKYSADEMEVIGINLAHTENSPQDVADYMNSHGYDWPVALDTEKGDISVAYNAINIPVSYFIDANGVIRAKHLGPMTLEQMETYLKRALRGS